MPQRSLSLNTIRRSIILAASSHFSKTELANHLKISRSTLRKYALAFRQSSLSLSEIEHLSNAKLAIHLCGVKMARPRSNRYIYSSNNATDIHARLETEKISLLDIWRQYAATGSLVYKYSQFSAVYRLRCKANHIKRPPKNTTYLNMVRESDIFTLKNWKHSGNRHLWERSTAIRELSSGETLVRVCSKIRDQARRLKDGSKYTTRNVLPRWHHLNGNHNLNIHGSRFQSKGNG